MALTDKLTAIGNAIREKEGTTELIQLGDMPTRILNLPTGGGGGDGEDAVRAGLVDYMDQSTSNLTKFVVPAGATAIPSSFFMSRSSLKTVEFEDISKITFIGSGGFEGCTVLEMSKLPPNLTAIGNKAFYNAKKVTFDEVPSSVRSIGTQVFYNASQITINTLPEGITDIGTYAFSNAFPADNPLPMFIIPSTVKTIGASAFNQAKVQAIRFLGTPTNINKNAFAASGYSSLISHVYVPWGSDVAISNVTTTAPWGLASATIHYNVAPEDVIE